MKSKKILITVIALVVALLGVIAALVVVLVNSNQSAKSNVTVTYVAEDVACQVSASYAMINIPAENTEVNYFTSMKDETSSTTLTISEATASGSLNPSGDIALDMAYSRVVFEYRFSNTMKSTPMYVELTGMPDNDTEGESLENIGLLYYNTYVSEDALFSGVYDEELKSSMGKLVVPAQCTKYVYLIATVNDLYANASFTGEIEWTLTRGEKPITTDVTAGSSLSLSNLYVGCEVTESDLNHSTVNIRTLDWYTDSSLSTKATFPVITTESTTLYSNYLKGNIPEENLTYSAYYKRLEVTDSVLVTDAISSVAGYTPITSTDTTLVIPDMFELSDGRILPIVYYGYGELLDGNTTITTVYVGNNVRYYAYTDSSSSALLNIYLGSGVHDIGAYSSDYSYSNNLTNVYFKESTISGWSFRNSDYWAYCISESTLSSSTESAALLQQLIDMPCDLYRFYDFAPSPW